MESLGPELRKRLWAELDWSSAAPMLAAQLSENSALAAQQKAPLLRQLAGLCEFAVLDPKVVADVYGSAYQADRNQLSLLARMRHLCEAMGRSDQAARTAELEYRQSKDPRFHAIAGQSWLDAGEPDRALRPLLEADKFSPNNPHVLAALEVARREWANPYEHAMALLEKARREDTETAVAALQAARILRMLDHSGELYEEALALCLRAQPNLPSACKLMEVFLFEEERLEDLARHFQRRAGAAPNTNMAARFLFQGSSLLFRAGAGTHAAPLFAEGITQATRSNFKSIPGLLAQLRALFITGSSERNKVVLYAEQVCDQLESLDERVGISILCSQIAWHALKDREAAETWMRRLRELCGEHRLVVDFESGRSAGTLVPPPLPGRDSDAP